MARRKKVQKVIKMAELNVIGNVEAKEKSGYLLAIDAEAQTYTFRVKKYGSSKFGIYTLAWKDVVSLYRDGQHLTAIEDMVSETEEVDFYLAHGVFLQKEKEWRRDSIVGEVIEPDNGMLGVASEENGTFFVRPENAHLITDDYLEDPDAPQKGPAKKVTKKVVKKGPAKKVTKKVAKKTVAKKVVKKGPAKKGVPLPETADEVYEMKMLALKKLVKQEGLDTDPDDYDKDTIEDFQEAVVEEMELEASESEGEEGNDSELTFDDLEEMGHDELSKVVEENDLEIDPDDYDAEEEEEMTEFKETVADALGMWDDEGE